MTNDIFSALLVFFLPSTVSSFIENRFLCLEKPLENVKPISLASKSITEVKECTVAGWGAISLQASGNPPAGGKNDLKQLQVKPMEQGKCLHRIALTIRVDVDEEERKNILEYIFCCENKNSKQKMSFAGDSGGPLVCDNELHGISSQVIMTQPKDSNEKRLTGTFVQVGCYMNWINAVLEKLGDEKISSSKDFTQECTLDLDNYPGLRGKSTQIGPNKIYCLFIFWVHLMKFLLP